MAPPRKCPLPNELVVTLIHEVKTKGECVWNTDDEKYNDRFHVISFWRDIAKTMELPEEVLKTKWKNLRDLFKREEKRYGTQTIDDYMGKWRHFKSMWFLHRPDDFAPTDNERITNDNEDNFDIEFDGTAESFLKFEPSDRSEEVEVYLDDPIDPLPDKRMRYNDDDYDIMFLKSLTPYFRQLDPLRKLVLRSKIQDMLMNEIAAQSTASNLNLRKN